MNTIHRNNQEFSQPHGSGEFCVEKPQLPRFRISHLDAIDADWMNIEKLRLTRQTWHQLKAMAPHQLIGATLYGSRVKGNMRPGSDVDITIFTREGEVNLDQKELTADQASRQLFESIIADEPELPLSLSAIVGDQQLEDILGSIDDEIVRSSLENADVVPLSSEIIDDRVQDLVAETSGTYTGPGYIRMLDPAITMFSLSIDASINPYRRYFIDEVRSYGAHGDLAWKFLMERLAYHEEFRRGANIYLPQTPQDALHYWNLD